MTLRGLVEAFHILSDQDPFKKGLTETLKRGLNHVINYRLVSTNPTNCQMTYLFKTNEGTLIPWTEQSDDNFEKYIETTSKLKTVAKQQHFNSPSFLS